MHGLTCMDIIQFFLHWTGTCWSSSWVGGLELIHHACMAKNGKFVNLNPIALGREGRVRKGCDEESRGGGSPSFMQFIHPCMICHLNTYSMIHTYMHSFEAAASASSEPHGGPSEARC